MPLENMFMGVALPERVGYYVFLSTVEFRRLRPGGLDGEEDLGVIPKPIRQMPQEWWMEKATAILAKHKIKWPTEQHVVK